MLATKIPIDTTATASIIGGIAPKIELTILNAGSEIALILSTPRAATMVIRTITPIKSFTITSEMQIFC